MDEKWIRLFRVLLGGLSRQNEVVLPSAVCLLMMISRRRKFAVHSEV